MSATRPACTTSRVTFGPSSTTLTTALRGRSRTDITMLAALPHRGQHRASRRCGRRSPTRRRSATRRRRPCRDRPALDTEHQLRRNPNGWVITGANPASADNEPRFHHRADRCGVERAVGTQPGSTQASAPLPNQLDVAEGAVEGCDEQAGGIPRHVPGWSHATQTRRVPSGDSRGDATKSLPLHSSQISIDPSVAIATRSFVGSRSMKSRTATTNTGRVDPDRRNEGFVASPLGREERRLLPARADEAALIADVDIVAATPSCTHQEPPPYSCTSVHVGVAAIRGDPVSLTHQRSAAPSSGRLGPPDVVGAVGSRVDAALGNAEAR